MNFDRKKLNRAIGVLFNHTISMEPPRRLRLSSENRRQIQREREAVEHLIEFAGYAMKALGEHSACGTVRKPVNVRPADTAAMH